MHSHFFSFFFHYFELLHFFNHFFAGVMTFCFALHLLLRGKLDICGHDDLLLLLTWFCEENWTSPDLFHFISLIMSFFLHFFVDSQQEKPVVCIFHSKLNFFFAPLAHIAGYVII